MSDEHRIEPGSTVTLDTIPTTAETYHSDREEAEAEFKALRRELAELQHRLYSEGRQKLLVVLQAMDAGGKDSTIRRVFSRVNPQGVRVASFKAPTKDELAHDFLWRVHKQVPGKGMIRVFNRSHYEDVLIVRVDRLVPDEVWQARYATINEFEHLLAGTGSRILKFYLHISREEQRRRFQSRLDDPRKNWKFSLEDLEKRKQWDEYMAAYEAALEHCSTAYAPWFAIPSDQKWYRNLAIARILVATLRDMDPRYPEIEPEVAARLDDVTIT